MRRAAWMLPLVLSLVLAVGCTMTGPDGRPMRDPTGNAVWSLVIPGAGQFMNNQPGKGALMLALSVINSTSALEVQTDEEGEDGVGSDEEENETWGWKSDEDRRRALGLGFVLAIWSAADARKVAQDLNRTDPIGAPPPIYGTGISPPPEEPPLTVVVDPIGGRLSASFCCRF